MSTDNKKEMEEKQVDETVEKDVTEQVKEDEKQENEKTESEDKELTSDEEVNEKIDADKKDESKAELFEKEPFIDPSVYAHRRKKRIVKNVLLFVVGFVFVLYFGGVIFHLNHFGTMTTINGLDVSGKSVSEVENMLLDDAASYELAIKYKQEIVTLHAGDADSEAQLTQTVKSVQEKNTPFLWFVDMFQSYKYSIPYTVSCERNKLSTFLAAYKSMDSNSMVDPTNAKVIMEDGEVVVIPDKTGTKLDVEKVYDKVLNALKNYEQELDIESAGCYVVAHITTQSESILDTKKEAEDFLSIEACYDFGDYVYQIPREDLTRMAYVSEDGSVQISHNNVLSYAYRFSKKFSTSYSEREFTTHDGEIIQVYGGYYGWVMDPETEGEELYDLICQKKNFTKEPACEKRGYAMCEQNDIGSNYVEVDLTNQHVYCFKNGKKVWESDCVTGDMPGHKTPGGLFGITYKAVDATLTGPGYESPVSYWMPFNGGIGLHDANWRREFGGDIYTYDGSHGCVNLPCDKAGALFDLVEPGMPVVCYWRDEVTEIKD